MKGFFIWIRCLEVVKTKMGLFTLFAKNQLKLLWSFKVNREHEIIWKLLISPNGILAGEERNTETKTASLFALEVVTGKLFWRDKSLDEAWWFNTEKATEKNLYIQKFRKPDMPEPQGIIAVDIHTGDVRWEQPDVSMLFEFDNKIYAQREAFGRKEFFALDNHSGNVLEAYGSEKENILSLQSLVVDNDFHSVYSTPITPDDPEFEPIGTLLGDVLKVEELRGSIDFVEFGKYVIFCYHERIVGNAEAALDNRMCNKLKVLDTDKSEIVYADELNSNTPYPVPENFFIHQGILIYVKEKREVIGISLK